MTNPYYVSPEQVMKDRADYARKGIARGRSLVAMEYATGIVMVAENPSRTLHKISEIYDRIAFAGVGKYNEFQMLRDAGVRLADQKGYAYSRDDVVANELANTYAQSLGQVFTHEMKPYEVEILIAQLGVGGKPNEMFHVLYDGTVMDEHKYSVLGGNAEEIETKLEESYSEGMTLNAAVKLGAKVLRPDESGSVEAQSLEVGYLDGTKERRCFTRMTKSEIEAIVA
jgi:proteasome alpha subunit